MEKSEIKEQTQRICQSCGKTLTDELLGTNADGSKNADYCNECYKNGAFTEDFTLEELIEGCSANVDKVNAESGTNLTREQYADILYQYYSQLKRWQELPKERNAVKEWLCSLLFGCIGWGLYKFVSLLPLLAFRICVIVIPAIIALVVYSVIFGRARSGKFKSNLHKWKWNEKIKYDTGWQKFESRRNRGVGVGRKVGKEHNVGRSFEIAINTGPFWGLAGVFSAALLMGGLFWCLFSFTDPTIVPSVKSQQDEELFSGVGCSNIYNIDESLYVDMGTSVMWAKCNVGASSPEEYGTHFAWGEVEASSSYSWENYSLCQGRRNALTKYCLSNNYGQIDDMNVLQSEDDAATHHCGEGWRTPTLEEYEELMDDETVIKEFVEQKGVYGCLVTSKITGNSLFFPMQCRISDDPDKPVYEPNIVGNYWTANIVDSIYCYLAYDITFNEKDEDGEVVCCYRRNRMQGLLVRPVCDVY